MGRRVTAARSWRYDWRYAKTGHTESSRKTRTRFGTFWGRSRRRALRFAFCDRGTRRCAKRLTLRYNWRLISGNTSVTASPCSPTASHTPPAKPRTPRLRSMSSAYAFDSPTPPPTRAGPWAACPRNARATFCFESTTTGFTDHKWVTPRVR